MNKERIQTQSHNYLIPFLGNMLIEFLILKTSCIIFFIQANKVLNDPSMLYMVMRISPLIFMEKTLTAFNSFYELNSTLYSHFIIPLLDILYLDGIFIPSNRDDIVENNPFKKEWRRCLNDSKVMFQDGYHNKYSLFLNLAITFVTTNRIMALTLLNLCTIFVFNDNLFELVKGLATASYLETTYKNIAYGFIEEDDYMSMQDLFIFNSVRYDIKEKSMFFIVLIKSGLFYYLYRWAAAYPFDYGNKQNLKGIYAFLDTNYAIRAKEYFLNITAFMFLLYDSRNYIDIVKDYNLYFSETRIKNYLITELTRLGIPTNFNTSTIDAVGKEQEAKVELEKKKKEKEAADKQKLEDEEASRVKAAQELTAFRYDQVNKNYSNENKITHQESTIEQMDKDLNVVIKILKSEQDDINAEAANSNEKDPDLDQRK